MTRRDRLCGHTYAPAPGVRAEVRRSCRDELKIFYEAAHGLPRPFWESVAALGTASVLEASKIHPSMKDLFRVSATGMRFEGAVGGTVLTAFFRGRGRLRARHVLERAITAALTGSA